ncbi:MAG TPA: hypothetical protein VLG50_05355 [Candidatus Saccharimonadales bacterium]|nr:hypothetical protein [Candidatus Saccharimonadales bacterium]
MTYSPSRHHSTKLAHSHHGSGYEPGYNRRYYETERPGFGVGVGLGLGLERKYKARRSPNAWIKFLKAHKGQYTLAQLLKMYREQQGKSPARKSRSPRRRARSQSPRRKSRSPRRKSLSPRRTRSRSPRRSRSPGRR